MALSLLVSLCLTAVAAANEPLTASGDAKNLWIIKPSPAGGGFTILHRRTTDQPESKISSVPAIKGTLIPGGAVAGDGFLWLFYADGSVQSIRVVEDGIGRRGFTDIILPSLPRGIKARSIAVTRTGAWVLARVEDQRLLDVLDQPAAEDPSWRERRRKAPPLPVIEAEKTKTPEPTAAPESAPTTPQATPETPAPPKPVSVKADRLLHLSQNQWETIPLPADWNVDAPAWLVTQAYEDARPLLVTSPTKEKIISWFTWAKPDGAAADAPEQWISWHQTVDFLGVGVPSVIERQLVVAHRRDTPGKVEFVISHVRPERSTLVGTLSATDRGGPWALTPLGDRLALITADKDGQLSLTRINLRGSADEQPVLLAPEPPSIGQIADLLIFVLVLALATPVLILMWKREPAAVPVQLPRGLRIGDLTTRGMAAILDLFPCLYLATLIRGVSFDDMINYWPGKSGGWEPMIPGAIAIGLYIGHTFLTELFTARTLGKAMLGLRVTGLKGEPPDIWQVLARNLFKVLDLIALPLLIFAIISPSRQRLGDVVGRTVVVAAALDDDGTPKSNRRADEEDDEDDRDDPPDPRPKRPK